MTFEKIFGIIFISSIAALFLLVWLKERRKHFMFRNFPIIMDTILAKKVC